MVSKAYEKGREAPSDRVLQRLEQEAEAEAEADEGEGEGEGEEGSKTDLR